MKFYRSLALIVTLALAMVLFTACAQKQVPQEQETEEIIIGIIDDFSGPMASMCLAYLDPAGLFDKKGKLLPLSKLPEEVRRAIVGFEVITQPKGALKFKYKLSDKGRSLERLERIQGMFAPEKHEITGKDGTAIDLTAMIMKVTEENATASKS